MNSFSMFYSHMMDTASDHPVLRLQNDNNINTLKDVQEIASLLPKSSNLFEKKVDGNMVVIVSGVKSGNLSSLFIPFFFFFMR